MIGFYAAGAMSTGSPVPVLWTPSDLPVPPKVWCDWNSSVTDVSGFASSWGNQGSLGGSLDQSTPDNRPAILASEINGKRALRFDGTNDGLIGDTATFSSLFRNVRNGLAVALYKKRGTDGSGGDKVVVRAARGTGDGTQAGVRFDLQCSDPASANALRMGVRRLDADTFSSIIANPSSGAWSIASGEMRWGSGIGMVYQNGAITGRNVTLTSTGVTSNTAAVAPLYVGFDRQTSFVKHADIDLAALVILSDNGITSMDRQRIEGWMAWECGLESTLPAEHPYRNSPPVVTSAPLSLTDQTSEVTLSVTYVQGVEVSSGIAWVTSSGESTVLRKYNMSGWSVVASAAFSSLTPGISPTSLGDPLLYDGVLYIPCGTYVDGGNAYVIEVDPDTLTYITHHDLSAYCGSGLNSIVRYNGKWYVGETASNDPDAVPALRRFDHNFTYEAEVWSSASGLRVDFNGATMVDGTPYMVAGGHGDAVYVFRLGSAVELVDEINLGLVDVQGVSCDGGYLYVSYRSGGERIERYSVAVL